MSIRENQGSRRSLRADEFPLPTILGLTDSPTQPTHTPVDQQKSDSQKEKSLNYPGGKELRLFMIDHFSISDLQNICFDLGIEHESFPISSKPDFVRELLLFCIRKGPLLDSLLMELQMARRHSFEEKILPLMERSRNEYIKTIRPTATVRLRNIDFSCLEKNSRQIAVKGVVYYLAVQAGISPQDLEILQDRDGSLELKLQMNQSVARKFIEFAQEVTDISVEVVETDVAVENEQTIEHSFFTHHYLRRAEMAFPSFHLEEIIPVQTENINSRSLRPITTTKETSDTVSSTPLENTDWLFSDTSISNSDVDPRITEINVDTLSSKSTRIDRFSSVDNENVKQDFRRRDM